LWRQVRDQQLPFFAGDAPLWRFSVKASAPHWRRDADWLIDWGGAQRWLRGELDHSTLEQEAESAGGQAALYRHGNRTGEVFSSLHPGVQRLHQRLKDAFDPGRVFNPGRLYSWI
jgi:glycolate oxidase FAD binding subunit